VRRGKLQALWSIQVASQQHEVFHRGGNGRPERRTKRVHTVEWVDDHEAVHFGPHLESEHERWWVVGEVVAWLEQVGPPVCPAMGGSGW
jgi:hypothetical protein